MKITKTPDMVRSSLGSGNAGSVDGVSIGPPGATGPGQGIVSSSSNTASWQPIVSTITANGSNTLLGPNVNFASGLGISFGVASNTLTITALATASNTPNTLGWYNWVDYGAVGDGVADDTARANAAIAAYNAGGGGVLYIPQGSYLITSGLTALTAPGLVLGDGMGTVGQATQINCTSATASLFTVNSNGVGFSRLALSNTAGSTPTAGAGITVTNGVQGRYENVSIHRFYINLDIQTGNVWAINGCDLQQPVLYALKVRNTTSADAGDSTITNTIFTQFTTDATAAIRIEGAGGLKITNCKINGGNASPGRFAQGIDLQPTGVTTILMVTNTSIENVTGNGINVVTGSSWDQLVFHGLQFGLYANSTGNAIKINCGTLGDVDLVIIAGCVFKQTGGGTAAAIDLTKVNNAYLTALVRDGFGSMLAQSGSTSILDATGGVAAGVAISGTPSSGQVPTATSASAATWQTPSATPSGAAGGDLSGTYPNPSVVDDSHAHTGATAPALGPLLIESTHASPIVYDDILQASDGADFLYASEP